MLPCKEKVFANVIKLRTVKWEIILDYTVGLKFNHKCLYKREADERLGTHRRAGGDVKTEAETGVGGAAPAKECHSHPKLGEERNFPESLPCDTLTSAQ